MQADGRLLLAFRDIVCDSAGGRVAVKFHAPCGSERPLLEPLGTAGGVSGVCPSVEAGAFHASDSANQVMVGDLPDRVPFKVKAVPHTRPDGRLSQVTVHTAGNLVGVRTAEEFLSSYNSGPPVPIESRGSLETRTLCALSSPTGPWTRPVPPAPLARRTRSAS